MRKLFPSLLAALAVVVFGSALSPVIAAEGPFDLEVQLTLSSEMTSQLQSGDLIQITLRPETQYGIREIPGDPVVIEKKWEPGMTLQPLKFSKGLTPEMIYRIDVRILRNDTKGRPIEGRYLCALDRLPRRPVEKGVKMRLFLGDPRDARNNLLLLNRDSDGIYRLSVFTA